MAKTNKITPMAFVNDDIYREPLQINKNSDKGCINQKVNDVVFDYSASSLKGVCTSAIIKEANQPVEQNQSTIMQF